MNITDTLDITTVYSEIAVDFDKTRYPRWKAVREFIDSLPSESTFCDIGCGNGKYLDYRRDLQIYGCDICTELLNIAKQRNTSAELIKADIRNLPYKTEEFDNVISIAVLHHMKTEADRIKFIQEIIRVLKQSGRALITVWASDIQDDHRRNKWTRITPDATDYIIPYTTKEGSVYNRYYHLYSREELIGLVTQYVANAKIETIEFEKNNWQITIRKS